jgi:4'-phosphopantetheinyl transferase
MIHWLIQSARQHTELARGVAPSGLLNAAEETQFNLLKTSKRRRDWLLGRWTVKHLVRACLEQDRYLRLPLNAIAIYNDMDGSPHVMAGCGASTAEWAVSISHSNGHAFCAATPRLIGLGADIECIGSREWSFVEDFFTPDEITRVGRAPLDRRATIVTAIWSAKEAALKALHLGLTIDTRRISCTIDPGVSPPNQWLEFTMQCTLGCQATLRGWWRVWNEHVLVIATRQSASLITSDA